jgi:hypothetical protein
MMKRFLSAVAVARAYLEGSGSQLRDPVYVSVSVEGRPKNVTWLVRDNADQRGGNGYLRIDDATGAVVEYTVPGAERTT